MSCKMSLILSAIYGKGRGATSAFQLLTASSIEIG